MIVQPREGTLLLVRQTDHAALSGTLAEHWGDGIFARPEPRASVVLAAARHDDGWRAWEERPKVNPATRRPYQFTEMPAGEHLAFYLQGVEEVVRADAYAGLLVAMHLAGLYKKRYGLDSGLKPRELSPEEQQVVGAYLERLETRQRQLREQLPRETIIPEEAVEDLAVWTNYRLLQVYDLFSLYLCTAPPSDRVLRHVPVNASRPDTEIALRPLGPDAVGVSPYPFDEAPLRVSVPARRVADRDYGSDEELHEALAVAPVVTLSFELRRA